MIRRLLQDIIAFSYFKKYQNKSWSYLLMGLLFFPYLLKDMKHFKEFDAAVSYFHEGGGDIYPLF